MICTWRNGVAQWLKGRGCKKNNKKRHQQRLLLRAKANRTPKTRGGICSTSARLLLLNIPSADSRACVTLRRNAQSDMEPVRHLRCEIYLTLSTLRALFYAFSASQSIFWVKMRLLCKEYEPVTIKLCDLGYFNALLSR